MNVKKKFKPHMMYKGKKAVMAKTMADHLRLNKLGYTHNKPKYNDGGKVKGMTTAQRKEEYVKEKADKVYDKAYDKAFKKDRNKTYGMFTRQSIPYKLTSESDKVAKPIALKAKKSAENKASKKFDKNTKYDDLLGRATNPDKKYENGGKVEKPVKNKMLNEVTVTAKLPSEQPNLLDAVKYAAATKTTAKTWKSKQHPSMVRHSVKPITGSPPMIGGTKMLGLGKNLIGKKVFMRSAPSLASKVVPKTASAVGEGIEVKETVDKIKKKFDKGGKTESSVNEAGNYTKPTMRKNLFKKIMAGTKGGRAGQWSARKAQLLAKLYKQNGGGYKN